MEKDFFVVGFTSVRDCCHISEFTTLPDAKARADKLVRDGKANTASVWDINDLSTVYKIEPIGVN
jgi:hypothetical protein